MTAIRLQQSLHGYADGHRLLASSVPLSQNSQRVMRVLSDLSGPRLVSGFDQYITGYTLPDDRLYVFARTWYADDADRPGCVWTHSLLLDNEALANVLSLGSLVPYFRRPGGTSEAFNEYKIAPVVPTVEVDLVTEKENLFLARVATALYGNVAPVVLPDTSAQSMEWLHLCMWQHYRQITGDILQFCAGAIQLREGPRGPFDLQTVPAQSMRDILRHRRDVSVVERDIGAVAPWAEAVVEQLREGDVSWLRELMEQYATFPGDGRSSVGAYIQIFQELGSSASQSLEIKEVLEHISALFPAPRQASRLKSAVAAGPGMRAFFNDVPDSALLELLMREGIGDAFSASVVDLPNRLIELWAAQPEGVAALVRIALHRTGTISEEIIRAFTTSRRLEEMPHLLALAPDLVPVVIQSCSEMGAFRELWKAPSVSRYEVLDILSARGDSLDNSVLDAIVSTQLDAEAYGVAFQMVSAFGVSRTASSVLKWLIKNKWRVPVSEWESAFESWDSVFVQWIERCLSEQGEEVFALPHLLSTTSAAVRRVSPYYWNEFIARQSLYGLDSYSSALYLVVLQQGLLRTGLEGEELVASAYKRIYLAAQESVLNDRWWQLVESQFDKAWRWDRCRTLRVGLVTKFADRGWSTGAFVKCLPDNAVFLDILSMWGWSKREKSFLARVINDILFGRVGSDVSLASTAQQCAHWF